MKRLITNPRRVGVRSGRTAYPAEQLHIDVFMRICSPFLIQSFVPAARESFRAAGILACAAAIGYGKATMMIVRRLLAKESQGGSVFGRL